MRLLKKIAAGFLLTIGLPVVVLALFDIVNPNTPADDRGDALAALIILGLPPTALGGWLVQNLRSTSQKSEQQKQLELEQRFLELLQESGGSLTVVQFATKAQLPIAEAKTYLDQKAVQLNGTFEATDTGGIVYRFPV
jgi:hypothetical protein